MEEKIALTKIQRAQRLYNLRLDAGYKNRETPAAMIGVSRQTLDKWENGAQHMTIDKLASVCSVYGCDPSYLIYADQELPTKEATDISNSTGLSEEVVNTLIEFNRINKAIPVQDIYAYHPTPISNSTVTDELEPRGFMHKRYSVELCEKILLNENLFIDTLSLAKSNHQCVRRIQQYPFYDQVNEILDKINAAEDPFGAVNSKGMFFNLLDEIIEEYVITNYPDYSKESQEEIITGILVDYANAYSLGFTDSSNESRVFHISRILTNLLEEYISEDE